MELNLQWRRMNSNLWPDVSFEIRPLKVWACQELLGPRNGTEPAPPPGAPPDGLRMMEVAKAIFPHHVRNLSGIQLRQEGAAEAATLEQLCEEALLLPLAGEILGRLVEISELTPQAEKN